MPEVVQSVKQPLYQRPRIEVEAAWGRLRRPARQLQWRQVKFHQAVLYHRKVDPDFFGRQPNISFPQIPQVASNKETL
jgi:hypothetical protein